MTKQLTAEEAKGMIAASYGMRGAHVEESVELVHESYFCDLFTPKEFLKQMHGMGALPPSALLVLKLMKKDLLDNKDLLELYQGSLDREMGQFGILEYDPKWGVSIDHHSWKN